MIKLNYRENHIATEYCSCSYDLINFTDSSIGLIYKAVVYIYRLYTLEEHRRKGFAKSMLREVIKTIRDFGYKDDIYIEATPTENSISKENLIKFYESYGLVVLNKQQGNTL